MNPETKNKIAIMHSQSKRYKEIAETLNLSVGTVKSYIHRHPMSPLESFCKYCGKPISLLPKRKKKMFCCDTCRRSWWKENSNKSKRKKAYHHTCAYCEKEFDSYHASNKFCSRKCFADFRKKVR